MTLLEHLEELRSRIIKVGLVIAAASVAGFFLSEPAIALLRTPLPEDTELIQLTVGESLGVRLRLALYIGAAISMPFILYQAWRFVTPGLTSGERRLVWPLLLAAIAFFALGLTLAYFIIPLAIQFLLGLALPGVDPMLRLSDYVGFVTTLMLAFGLALQFPVVLVLLARIGLVNHRLLAARRRWAVLAITVFAIFATPQDPFSTLILSGVMYLLFEGSLQVMRLTGRR